MDKIPTYVWKDKWVDVMTLLLYDETIPQEYQLFWIHLWFIVQPICGLYLWHVRLTKVNIGPGYGGLRRTSLNSIILVWWWSKVMKPFNKWHTHRATRLFVKIKCLTSFEYVLEVQCGIDGVTEPLKATWAGRRAVYAIGYQLHSLGFIRSSLSADIENISVPDKILVFNCMICIPWWDAPLVVMI